MATAKACIESAEYEQLRGTRRRTLATFPPRFPELTSFPRPLPASGSFPFPLPLPNEGDITAARHKVEKAVKHASKEIETVTRDMWEELHELQRRQQRAAAQLLPALQDQMAQVEHTLVPVLERHYLQAKKQLETIQHELSRPLQQDSQRALPASTQHGDASSEHIAHQQLLLAASGHARQ
ncbi:hypothetical protein HaLaN_08284 [Haematococcus lacustris]|uniref:Uncharacterized protein n=1 Tax=Haematococcus lacustris TaxID=44745 RepID=A0A699ZAT1_HAELA|nr:hypothetical protein HaLaN_08284 [Haematococcus lacustris]